MAKNTVLDKTSKDRAYEIAINPKYDGYQRGLASMVYQFFDQKKQDQQRKQTNCWVKNYTNQQIKNSKDEKSMLGLKIIFGQQISLT